MLMMTDEHWMTVALTEARAAAAAGDVPVGAVIVSGESIIGRGRNRRELDKDPTAHAEVVALREASRALGTWRVEATLYVTQEPCPMCAGALVNARVKRLVYGCPNPKAGAVASLFSIVTDARLNHRMEVTSNVLATECAAVLTTFFAELRRGPTYGS
jgi:tRNA(adenine34) deaminase